MDYTKYLTSHQVLLDCTATSKHQLLEQMLDALERGPLFAANPQLTRDVVKAALLQREEERPTVLSGSVACPHARIPELIGVGGALAVLREPLVFDEISGAKADLVVMLVVPSERPPVALKMLGNVALLGQTENRSRILASRDPGIVADAFAKQVFTSDLPLFARDVMRPPICEVYADSHISRVVHRMIEFSIESVGITSPTGTLLGEITSDALFVSGMPEFFNQLKSVSFIKEFDPFDRYFEKVAGQTAGEVMSTDVARVTEDATILEVIFLLSVRRYAKVYVERDGKLVGVIDRARVLNEVLNA